MTRARIGRRGVRMPAGASRETSYSVLVDGHRVWSFRLLDTAPSRRVLVRWPPALRARLKGSGRFAVVAAVTGETLAERRLAFPGARGPIDLTDRYGRMLSVNKWGRLGASLEGGDEEFRRRLVSATRRVLATLQQHGLTAFVVGGTLLGAVRSGRILDNDDDADLAYLSEHEHPSDLVLESFEIERALTAAGFLVSRHSGAHLQVQVRAEDGYTDFYVDVFTAFFRGETFYEPIHVEARLERNAIAPLGAVTLESEEFPAPADPEAWLAACYGDGWRVPDPSFTFETPERTLRAFDAWFGESKDLARPEWNVRHQDRVIDDTPSEAVLRFAERLPERALVLELGCGTGTDSLHLAALGHDVVGVDYSWIALERARERARERGLSAEFVLGNLLDRRVCVRLAIGLLSRRRPVHVFADHLVEQLIDDARRSVFALFRWLLRSGGFVWLTSHPVLPPGYDPKVPESWHLPFATQSDYALAHGLRLSVAGSGTTRRGHPELDTMLRATSGSPGSAERMGS